MKRPRPHTIRPLRKPPPIVYVRWLDAAYTNEYIGPGCQIAQGIVSHTVGFLIDETPHMIIIGALFGDDGRFRHFWEIPRSWVLSYRRLGAADMKGDG